MNLSFFLFDWKKYRDYMNYDNEFNASFRVGKKKMPFKLKFETEYRFVKLYRKYQANIGNFWGKFYKLKLKIFAKKTGIECWGNPYFGKGIIIGHWGRIIVNEHAKFGDNVMLTHGVTIGRDVRGKRQGIPTFGNNIVIRANSTVVGNINVGDDVLIAPNTFVNFDVPSHSVVVGNPASIHHRENATEGHIGKVEINE